MPGAKLIFPGTSQGNQKTLLKIDEIEIKPLLDALGFAGWNGSGFLNGTASFNKNEDGALMLEDFQISNEGVGILKIQNEAFFKLIDMEELEKETLKLALENFQYNVLRITASGTYPDEIKISVFASGKNPDLMQGRAFSFGFEITPDLKFLEKKLAANP